jgi:hypothetical protein
VTARGLITPAFDNLVSTAHNKGEYGMPRTFCDLNLPTLTELISDPIVQMAMSADHVTEQRLMSLISDTLSKLAVGSQSGSAGNPSPGFADYRPGVGIMLLNANNDVANVSGNCHPAPLRASAIKGSQGKTTQATRRR